MDRASIPHCNCVYKFLPGSQSPPLNENEGAGVRAILMAPVIPTGQPLQFSQLGPVSLYSTLGHHTKGSIGDYGSYHHGV
jgi:hypothetical protein